MSGKVLELVASDDPVLRKTAAIVNKNDLRGPAMREFIDNLVTTCLHHGAQGIAAPQVGLSSSVIVVNSFPNKNFPDSPTFGPIVMVNPMILEYFGLPEKGWEGCLSLMEVCGKVERCSEITVRYLDRDGNEQTTVFQGHLARIYQHEVDHIHGFLFTDHVNPDELVTREEFMKIRAEELAAKEGATQPT